MRLTGTAQGKPGVSIGQRARRRAARACAAGVLLACLALRAAAAVLIVGPGQYASLQQAVDAAAEGDLILVRSAAPGAATVDGKGLVLVADAGKKPLVIGTLAIRNLAPDQDVLVAGISATHPTGIPLDLRDNLGSVRILGGTFTGGDGKNLYGQPDYHPDGYSAAYLTTNADVAFTRTTFVGGYGATTTDWWYEYPVGDGAPAVFVRSSNVAFYHCPLTGGAGGSCFDVHDYDGGDGGSGIETPDAFVFASGSVLKGGKGGNGGDAGAFTSAGSGGAGGHGIWLHGTAQSEAQLLDNTYLPGSGGYAGWGGGGVNGNPGVAIQADSGAIANQIPGLSRSLEIGWPLHEQSPAILDLQGQPQDFVYLLFSAGAEFHFSPPFQGTLLTGKPLIRRVVLGTIGSTGTLQYTLNLPPLAAGLEHLTWYVQAAFVDPLGQVTLADGSALIVLDSAY